MRIECIEIDDLSFRNESRVNGPTFIAPCVGLNHRIDDDYGDDNTCYWCMASLVCKSANYRLLT